jgi:hypothetical protein
MLPLRKAAPAILASLMLATSAVAAASIPSVADLDASQRAAGNRLDLATTIGRSIFSVRWSAQVTQVSANDLDGHTIVGIRLWGVKFHHPMTRDQFTAEIAALVQRAFEAAPHAEEIDVWASVPIQVGKGVIVSGDLAKPTTRTVFSLSVQRGESAASIARRAVLGPGAFWDEEWAETAFQKQRS